MTGPDGLCVKCGADLKNWRETLGAHDCKPEPATFRCDTWRSCGSHDCPHVTEHEPWGNCDERRAYCSTSDTMIQCLPVPEPAAPHGVVSLYGLAGKAETVFAEIKHLADLEAKGELRLVDIAKDRKAVAERIMRANGQGDREAEVGLELEVNRIVNGVYAGGVAGDTSDVVGSATARIMKLIGEGE